MVVLDEEDRRLGIVQLVGDLRRGEPPRDRVEDRTGLRAREHERNVLARVAGERRDAVPVRQATSQLVGPRVELRVGPGAAGLVDRDPLRGDPGAVADDPVDRLLVHRRNSVMILTDASGSSQKNR